MAASYYNGHLFLIASGLRDLRLRSGQDCGMLAVMEDTRSREADAHAAWSERFNELFAQVADSFPNARVRRHGRTYLMGLLSRQEQKASWQVSAGGWFPVPGRAWLPMGSVRRW